MNRLSPFTELLNAQNEVLSEALGNFLKIKAEEETFENKLIEEAPGKSQAEKTMRAKATEKWLLFHLEVARIEKEYHFQKTKYQILEKEWLGQHLDLKLDAQTIKMQT